MYSVCVCIYIYIHPALFCFVIKLSVFHIHKHNLLITTCRVCWHSRSAWGTSLFKASSKLCTCLEFIFIFFKKGEKLVSCTIQLFLTGLEKNVSPDVICGKKLVAFTHVYNLFDYGSKGGCNYLPLGWCEGFLFV